MGMATWKAIAVFGAICVVYGLVVIGGGHLWVWLEEKLTKRR